MKKYINILHLENDANDAKLICDILKKSKLEFIYKRTENKIDFATELVLGEYNVILASFILPGLDGISVLEMARKSNPLIPFIFVSSILEEEIAVKTLKHVATDYVLKSNLKRLAPAIGRAIKEADELKNRRSAEGELEKVRSELTNLFENLDEVIFSLDIVNNVVLQISSACEKIYGYPKRSFFENVNLLKDVIHPEDKNIVDEKEKLFRTGISVEYQNRIIRKDGGIRWVESKIKPVVDSTGNLIRLDGIISDITKRIESQLEIENSLKEKELLLKEIHHRVKNNLQIISSLLKLQSSHIKDERLHDIFRDTQNRVMSMAFIHQRLYQSASLSRIVFGEYLEKLIFQLFKVYGFESRQIALVIESNNIDLNIDTAVPCGLLVNEIVSNSLKHAYPDHDKPGEIKISLHFDGKKTYKLTISDNGVGMPEKLKHSMKDSFGMQLITTLVEQLDGKIELDSVKGTRYTITFSEQVYPNRM